jgi:hypothetical protein
MKKKVLVSINKLKFKNICLKFLVDKFTSAISIRNNWKRLVTVELSTKDLQSLQCIQAVRVYATLWVIMIHTGITLTSSFVLNPLLLERVRTDFNVYKRF